MNTKSYLELLEENTALKLLLEEAHNVGQHTWSCNVNLKGGYVSCNCWYGKTAEQLVGDKAIKLVPLSFLVCKHCKHLAKDHTGTILGQPQPVCTTCDCPCFRFEPEPLHS